MSYREQFFNEADIRSDISRIKTVLDTKIFEREFRQNPLLRAAFTELIVCLNDLLQKAKAMGVPVTFNDEIPRSVNAKSTTQPNITDFVSVVRNIICHVPSKNAFAVETELQALKNPFSIVDPPEIPSAVINGIPLFEPKYHDDFCFTVGQFMLYYNHHILRALREAKVSLAPLVPGIQVD